MTEQQKINRSEQPKVDSSPRDFHVSKKEGRFFRSLRDVFVGAKVEGESGYINLMAIKSRYYENGVFPKLKQDIEEALKLFPDFRDELFDKLFTFFNRYFSESGSIYFRYTPLHQNIYEKVYTDDKDVMLFWKTHMLYYVKSDRLFRNLEVELDGFKFYFDVSTLEHKKANEKREINYEFKERREDDVLVFSVSYSEKGKKTKIDEILKELRKQGAKVVEEILERAFRVFERQSEVDYFINKNAKAFLQEQFNLWLYQYVFSGESEWTETRIKQLQALKDIAFKIIDFISQFEDELVKIWNKPKFVLNSNYVITLDRIASPVIASPVLSQDEGAAKQSLELIERVLNHPNFELQVEEWKELGIVDTGFNASVIMSDSEESQNLLKRAKSLNPKYRFLPIDTKHFKDLELEILGLFDNLDESLDGWFIKSENYQALNTILPKFREKVKCLYIDPPFNLESSDQFMYRTNYKDSCWATLLENRISIARDLLSDDGLIFVRCDYNGNFIVRCLLDQIFGNENFKNELIINRIKKNVTEKGRRNIPAQTDSLFVYSKTESGEYINILKKLDKNQEAYWHAMDSAGVPGPRQVVIEGKTFYPPDGRHFSFPQKQVDEMYIQGRIRINPKSGKPQYLVLPKESANLDTNWTDISGYSFSTGFSTENSEVLLERVINTIALKNDLVLDFFAGSATTQAVAQKYSRRWIGVEMGEHFYGVVLPRMERVLAYDKGGISKNIKDYQGGGFFKYYEFERYEDALRKVKYDDSDLFGSPYQDPYSQYIFIRDLKMLEALEVDMGQNKVKVDLSKLYSDPSLPLRTGIDIPETLSNLKGKWIKRITSNYLEFEDGEKVDIKNLDWKLIKPLIWW
ncbi:MAG: site-specific DNA-methyltransferase [Deltaproteobacteria bacterium]|nr:site-specific DNA-methyltransferase [Deltaproteobacteria bacterium]